MSRRTLLIGIAAFLADAALMPRFSIGQSVPPTASGANAGAGNANTAVASGAFLALSKALTGHADLNPETAGRMAVALHGLNPDFATQVASLSALVQPGQEPKALLESASAVAGLREAALAIVAAWYTGTIGSGAKATVVSYYEALMYRPTADAQEVPTYCTHGGGWWTEAPPEAGVGAPQERPAASAPSTVGTPEPKQQPGKS
ncbi:sugar dehydrogenase complex small subunit [Herbaspirillum autotrophicum]|uniref:sugar dehydrogenase complex small subunit n=1 Tax=Herbaspirillum autotrophicum TaxID=180195 RepID=UPI00067D6AE4|nr:sugar dehydrogenase complex small subunit [Herbaspirillum autotrophicum]